MRILSVRVLTLTMVIAAYAAPCLGAPTIINSHGEQIDSVFAGANLRKLPMQLQRVNVRARHALCPLRTPFLGPRIKPD